MAEGTSGRRMIVKLATAYRINFPGNEKSKQIDNPPEAFGNGVVRSEDSNLTDISKSLNVLDNKGGMDSSDGDEMMWNKVFIQLRPPSKSSKGKSLQTGVKFLNRSCEEIVDIIKTFSENGKQGYNERRQESQSFSHIFHNDLASFRND